uniref:Ribosomal protein S19 n=1 Tax=Storeatula sp. CCMP1868 TaxID=195070 RepID=A0A2P1G883_9CRYP|nr:ribosomal protein S19 [Storeatula sp. CCMP1868]AVM81159.1 ribosomal protein S19 [Storeatula sp. CCMP1868]
MRSIWKGPLIFKFSFNKKERLSIMNRKTTIFPCFVGKYFLVKNGSSYLRKIYVCENMVGLKFGDFAYPKKQKK